MATIQGSEKLRIQYVPLESLRHPERNPRKWTKEATEQLTESIKRHGFVDPLIVNSAPSREGIIIGGNFRFEVAQAMGYKEAPVVHVNIADPKKEEELIIRLNKNTGEFDLSLLAEFDESILADIGFTSEELDDIFPMEETPEIFDLNKELEKLDIAGIEARPGDIYSLGSSRLMVGDSTVKGDMERLMAGEKADLCFTDPPYLLDYLHGKKKNGKPTEGFGYKRDRKYIGTDVLPPDFTERWMENVASVAKPDFHIIVYENWKNLRTIWAEMEKYWKIKNMIVWHLPNRNQGYAAKYKLFSKYDIAMVGSSHDKEPLNIEPEDALLQEEYETALYALAGRPHWEGYEAGKKIQPTDFISFNASDEKHSGQGIVFGTKPTEILIPYIKVLTKRGDLVLEPFGGAGSTLIAATRLERRCFVMERQEIYAEVIKKRWEVATGQKAVKVDEKQ